MASTPTKVNIILGLALPVLLVLHLVKYLLTPIYRLLRSSRVPTVVRTPESRFGGLEKLGYPFAPNYYSIDVGSQLSYHSTCAGRLWGDPSKGPLCGRGPKRWTCRALPSRRACLVLPLQEDGSSPCRCWIQGGCSWLHRFEEKLKHETRTCIFIQIWWEQHILAMLEQR